MDPKGITNPVVRAEYQAYLDRHSIRMNNLSLGHKLRHAKTTGSSTMMEYIVDIYALDPPGQEEVDKLLDGLTDAVLRESIKQAIQKNRSEKLGRVQP